MCNFVLIIRQITNSNLWQFQNCLRSSFLRRHRSRGRLGRNGSANERRGADDRWPIVDHDPSETGESSPGATSTPVYQWPSEEEDRERKGVNKVIQASKMLEKHNDATLLKHSPTNTPFSIDSLLDKTKGVDVVPLKPPRPSLSLPGLPGGPLVQPGNLLLPHFLPPPGQGPPGLHPPDHTDGMIPSNLPFDLLARSYMSGILGKN